MPKQVQVYDNETGNAVIMAAVDADEAVKNDPQRYSLRKRSPLDHDGDGKNGGSLAGEESTRRRRRSTAG